MTISNTRPFLKTVSISLLSLISVLGMSHTALAKKAMTYSDPPEDSQLLGDYLSGSYANLLRDSEARAENFKQAFEASPKDVRLGRRAVTAALTNGDFDEARDLSRQVYKVEKTESMAQTILAIEAFNKGRHSTVSRYVNSNSADITMAIIMSFTEVWNYAANGKYDDAIKAAEKQDGRPFFGELAKLQKAKIYALSGNIDKANALYEELKDSEQSSVENVLSMARFYANSNQTEEAQKLLSNYIETTGIESGPIQVYADALAAGRSIEKPLPAEAQLSRALTEPSYGFFLNNRAADAAEVYLRLALEIDPKNEKAKLWLASLLDRTERSDAAMDIYKSFAEKSSYVISARLSEANIYFDRDEDDKALKVLTNLNDRHETFVTREALGRARLIREKYQEALPIYTAIVDSMSEEDITANTQPLYFRGIIYERIKEWDKAEKDFLRVLEIEPENADALNYLGYTWVDRGENLTRAFDMIRKAVELEPQSGAIIDSLGWAHYKLGEYEDAKIQLEKAVTLSPSSATIVDHLGDVYWKLGRYREAGYQWERALIYDPTDEERNMIKKKLKSGLSAATLAP